MLQMMSLGLDNASLGVASSPEAAQESSQRQSAWADVRAQAVQQGLLEIERERLQARQRGIMHQLEEQLASMRRRNACADSPADASTCSPLLPQPTLSSVPLQSSIAAAPATAAFEEQFQMRNVPAVSAVDHSAALDTQTTHSPGSALQRPRSVAQKAGMNVWSRHAARYGSVPLSRTACLFLLTQLTLLVLMPLCTM